MARHLTNEELIDLAEGMRAEETVPHIQTCERCRQQVVDLRATLSTAADLEVPEPSPLFWDHFSERVRQAVAAEASTRQTTSRGTWSLRFAIPLSMLAGAALAVLFLAGGRADRAGVPATSNAAATPAEMYTLDPAALEADDDLPLSLMADLVESADMDADDAREAGLSVSTDATERAVAALTEDEQRELERLLREELRHPGA